MSRRTARPRQARGRSRVGERFEAEVGPVAHGGHCVARLPEPESRVVFVRHALPGERVVVEITEGTDGDRFWRGDAVSVTAPSPDRVPAPCPVAGPGLCGGCDFQHVAVPAQRELKTAVVREQLVRLGRLPADADLVTGLQVEGVPVAGRPDDGLRWRTRQRYAVLPDGRPAMRAHRSHHLVPLDDCLIATEEARPAPAGGSVVEEGAERELLVGEGAQRPSGDPVIHEVVAAGRSHPFTAAADGFWQVHPEAPRVLVETVLDLLQPQPGERALDLYAGVGLFGRFVGEATGSRVVAVEADRTACQHARANLSALEAAVVECGPTDRVLKAGFDEPFDLVVLDPPREGAKRAVVEQVVDRRPRAVAYVACDPAALGRDVAIFAEHGYELTAIRAFDLFPMTHHVECVALLEPRR
ncbi:tRNA/tmRNA/rRNA uracil-C5-methylase, TrmA/RlmC/RlmD family [Nocardioides alpinus]|uniref:Class I SAM-dependent RNA methyltransferase n=1 Tax=Nocardioides alpinus TaxID=748909 RepID=A0A1I1B002_9ACTN|nr:TRAM domain-containing protein [Nocardioides alpinus]PKH41423.1 class I SAM-dependent RNA methyltransferase [Nocardioides alpinus]SFB43664.1 tRNA/tmRNA/rRNA uracil-C5-methylase, TrmA/RlmC/RlmD family [Nocardioides alpinus]